MILVIVVVRVPELVNTAVDPVWLLMGEAVNLW